jgi:hypothetical protein
VHWALIAVRPIAAPQGTDHRVLDLLGLVDFGIDTLKRKKLKNNTSYQRFPLVSVAPHSSASNYFWPTATAMWRQSTPLASSKIQE